MTPTGLTPSEETPRHSGPTSETVRCSVTRPTKRWRGCAGLSSQTVHQGTLGPQQAPGCSGRVKFSRDTRWDSASARSGANWRREAARAPAPGDVIGLPGWRSLQLRHRHKPQTKTATTRTSVWNRTCRSLRMKLKKTFFNVCKLLFSE